MTTMSEATRDDATTAESDIVESSPDTGFETGVAGSAEEDHRAESRALGGAAGTAAGEAGFVSEESGSAESMTSVETVDEATVTHNEQASTYEATSWDESVKNEAREAGTDEAGLQDAYYAEVDNEEFLQFLAPLVGPLVKTVLPAAAKSLVGSGLPASLLQGLGGLVGGGPRRRPRSIVGRPAGTLRRESGEEGSVEVDEAAIAEAVAQLEVVIGTDDRVRITNTREVPWKRICQLLITAGDGRRFLGTGWLIGPRTLVTAGHCVHMKSHGGWVRSIEVTPGRNAEQKPYGSMAASRVASVRGWTLRQHRDYDYAAVFLPRPFQANDIGSFGFAAFSDQQIVASKLNIAGYPGDKPAGTMWYHGRVAKSVTATRVNYDIDTFGGQSGAAVYIRRPDGKRYAVAIHTNGSPSGNSAVRITRPVFQNLNTWRTNPDG